MSFYIPFFALNKDLTLEQLNILVDLKQKQSDTMEARFSRKELEESVQLTKAARMQTQQSAKQGKTIMVFTMVTIIFVCLGTPNSIQQITY